MKLEVQLYIEGQRVDLFQDETISITSSIQNVRDIAKVFTDFSQSFSVPASQNNNKIFKHYYNPDVIGGFDARFKVDATIELNYQTFRTGKLKLDGVDLKDNKAYAYKITFYGSTIELKDLLGEDQLDSLDLSAYDVAYNYPTIETALESGIDKNGITDAIVCPLISAQEGWYYDSGTSSGTGNLAGSAGGGTWTSLKYAIRIHAIILAIEAKYGLTFSNDFFDSSVSDYYDLYMWLHREKGAITTAQNAVFGMDGFDEYQLFDFVTVSNGGSRFDFVTGGVDNVTYKNSMFLVVDDSAASFQFRVKSAGSVILSTGTLTGSTSYTISLPIISSDTYYEFEIVPNNSFNIVSNTSVTHTYYRVTRFENGSQVASNDYDLETDIAITAGSFTVISNNIPKMKVIDFLTGLFKMFNLTAYFSAGEIVVKPLSDFYASGSTYDITPYVDVANSSVMPSSLFKQIEFKYAGLKTLFSQNHFEQFNQEWASEDYIPSVTDIVDGDSYIVSVPFEHMKYERIVNTATNSASTVQWGWMVDRINDDGTGQPYIGLPLLFYPVNNSGNNIYIFDGSTRNLVTDYFVPSNSRLLTDSTNINFKAEFNEYANELFEDTLFELYYANYIESVFNDTTRVFNVTAYLPLKILTSYDPQDTFIVNDRAYKINSISTDLTTGKSEIELINIV